MSEKRPKNEDFEVNVSMEAGHRFYLENRELMEAIKRTVEGYISRNDLHSINVFGGHLLMILEMAKDMISKQEVH